MGGRRGASGTLWIGTGREAGCDWDCWDTHSPAERVLGRSARWEGRNECRLVSE